MLQQKIERFGLERKNGNKINLSRLKITPLRSLCFLKKTIWKQFFEHLPTIAQLSQIQNPNWAKFATFCSNNNRISFFWAIVRGLVDFDGLCLAMSEMRPACTKTKIGGDTAIRRYGKVQARWKIGKLLEWKRFRPEKTKTSAVLMGQTPGQTYMFLRQIASANWWKWQSHNGVRHLQY